MESSKPAKPKAPPATAEPRPATGAHVLLGALMLLGIALGTRLIGVGSLPLWLDEVHTYIASTDVVPNLLHWETMEQQYHSPLPYIECKISRTLLAKQDRNVAMRMPSVVHGVAAVLLLYLMLGTLVNWSTAWWSGLLLAIQPFALEHAREARMYSLWLFFAIPMAWLAILAVQRTDRDDRSALDWPWWALGVATALAHAASLHALTTAAAVGLWVALAFGGCLLVAPGRAMTILGGSLVSLTVFLTSWSATGLGKLMLYMKPPAGSGATTLPAVSSLLNRATLEPLLTGLLTEISGGVPLHAAAALGAAVLIGLLFVAGRGSFGLMLLLIFISLAPLLMLPMASARMAFYSRYMHVALLGWTAGLGALLAALWTARRMKWIGRAIVIAGLGAMAWLWLPQWTDIYRTPRMRIDEAFAPINAQAKPGDVVVMMPDWSHVLTQWYPLATRLDPPLVGPPGGKAMPIGKTQGGAARELQAFGDVFTDDHRPGGAWLFVLEPDKRADAFPKLLQAYGIDNEENRAKLNDAARGNMTLTAYLSPDGLDHVLGTAGRRRP